MSGRHHFLNNTVVIMPHYTKHFTFSVTTVPPHIMPTPPRLTCHGTLPRCTLTPPTISPASSTSRRRRVFTGHCLHRRPVHPALVNKLNGLILRLRLNGTDCKPQPGCVGGGADGGGVIGVDIPHLGDGSHSQYSHRFEYRVV